MYLTHLVIHAARVSLQAKRGVNITAEISFASALVAAPHVQQPGADGQACTIWLMEVQQNLYADGAREP